MEDHSGYDQMPPLGDLLDAGKEVERWWTEDEMHKQDGAPAGNVSAAGRHCQSGGPKIMKSITLTQPWATLVAIGAKRIETRSWPTSFRGQISIHAAKTFPSAAKDFCTSRLVCRVLGWPECPASLTQEWLDDNALHIKALPVGCVLATATLVNCMETSLIRRYVLPFSEQEEAFGDYEPGRFGFLLENVIQLASPVPAKGARGLWEWEGTSN